MTTAGVCLAASVASAARAPTHAEREAITSALPAFIRSTPVECLWLEVRVSRNPMYARAHPVYLNARAGSRCLRYASDGFFVLKKTAGWRIVYDGSDRPACSLRIPRDLAPCIPSKARG